MSQVTSESTHHGPSDPPLNSDTTTDSEAESGIVENQAPPLLSTIVKQFMQQGVVCSTAVRRVSHSLVSCSILHLLWYATVASRVIDSGWNSSFREYLLPSPTLPYSCRSGRRFDVRPPRIVLVFREFHSPWTNGQKLHWKIYLILLGLTGFHTTKGPVNVAGVRR